MRKRPFVKQGAFIAALRERKNLTVSALADRINVPGKTVEHWEEGRFFPDGAELAELAGALDAPMADILAGEPGDENAARQALSALASAKNTHEERKSLLLFFLIVMDVIFLAVGLYTAQPSDSSLRWLASSWAFEIPRGLTEEYSISNQGFLGDGEVYIVYSDDGRADFNFHFQIGPNRQAETLAKSFLSPLPVPEEKLPDFSHRYLWQIVTKNGGNDQVVCFFDLETRQYYFISEFT